MHELAAPYHNSHTKPHPTQQLDTHSTRRPSPILLFNPIPILTYMRVGVHVRAPVYKEVQRKKIPVSIITGYLGETAHVAVKCLLCS